MRSSRSRSARVRVWYARAVLVVLLALGVSTLDHYADAGEGEKDCLVQVRPASPEVVQRIEAPYAGLVQHGGTVNDASCVNAVAVHGVVRPRTVREVRAALAYARDHDLEVAVGGTRHSMGGQAAHPAVWCSTCRDMASVTPDAMHGAGTGRAGRDLGDGARGAARGRSLGAGDAQHRRAQRGRHRVGERARRRLPHRSLAPSVRSLRIVLADGSLRKVSRDARPWSCSHAAVGGYGLFGVIVEVELDAVPDEMY